MAYMHHKWLANANIILFLENSGSDGDLFSSAGLLALIKVLRMSSNIHGKQTQLQTSLSIMTITGTSCSSTFCCCRCLEALREPSAALSLTPTQCSESKSESENPNFHFDRPIDTSVRYNIHSIELWPVLIVSLFLSKEGPGWSVDHTTTKHSRSVVSYAVSVLSNDPEKTLLVCGLCRAASAKENDRPEHCTNDF